MECKGRKDRKQGEGGKERRTKGRKMLSGKMGTALSEEKPVNCKGGGYYSADAGKAPLRRCRLSSDLNNEEIVLQIEKNDSRCSDL